MIDYAEVFVQPDAHDEALDPLDSTVVVAPSDDRTLLPAPAPGWETVARALVAPVLGDGSTVVAVGYDEPGLDALAVSERATR